METLQRLPEKMSEVSVDLDHPNRALIQGCFEEKVMVDNKERSFISYLPPNIEYCRPGIVVAPPSDCIPLEYLETSGLKSFADEQQLFIFLLNPQSGKWSEDGSDANFMNTVYAKVQARDYYVTMQDNLYAFGVGDGALIAHQAAKTMTSEWSGLISIGDLTGDMEREISGTAKEEEQGNLELKITAQKSQLPVWMVISSFGENNELAVDYWKTENKVTSEYLSGQGADYIWMPSPVRTINEINEEQIAQVRVTVGEPVVTKDLIDTLWRYVGMARRHRGYETKNLRYFKNPKEYGAVLQERDVDGLRRCWYEYIPEDCIPDQKWPLVVVMHGRGGSAETFFDISGMANVAKSRKFIAVFPQAGLYQQKQNGLKNVLLWDGFYNDTPIDDVKFIRRMVADIEKRLSVDHGRIYACGQSSGGMMTDLLCDSASDIFAACASWSAVTSPSRMYMQHEKTAELTPTMFIYGDRDTLAIGNGTDSEFPFSMNDEIKETISGKIKRYQLDPARVQIWENNPITWYSYPNKEGVPMLVVGVVKNMVHANYPEESWISYDQFLCQFNRGTDGALYYREGKVGRDER